MKRNYVLKELVKFLKENNAYTQYRVEMYKQRKDYFFSIRDLLFLERAISGGFPWDNSNKDVEFWINLNVKWKKFFRENLKENPRRYIYKK